MQEKRKTGSLKLPDCNVITAYVESEVMQAMAAHPSLPGRACPPRSSFSSQLSTPSLHAPQLPTLPLSLPRKLPCRIPPLFAFFLSSSLPFTIFVTMQNPPHVEKHFTSSNLVRDIIIGMSDGLTVPFALAAGLSGSTANSSIVVTAGLAEVAAGAIAMGLGGYLAAKSDTDHYDREERREKDEIVDVPEKEADEVAEILAKFGLQPAEYKPIVEALRKRPDDWLEFMMRFELGLEKPDPTRALKSAATIAMSYIVGGIIPLVPYMAVHSVREALFISIGITLFALFVFGFFKGHFTGTQRLKSAVQTVVVGATASAAAFALARAIQATNKHSAASSVQKPSATTVHLRKTFMQGHR